MLELRVKLAVELCEGVAVSLAVGSELPVVD